MDLQPAVVSGPSMPFLPLPEYLKLEQARNLAATRIFHRFLHRAVGQCEILVAHHIVFELPGGEPNEIPSADTLLFNPLLMGRVFGQEAPMIMSVLAHREPEIREQVLKDYLDALDVKDPEGVLP